MKKSKQSKQLPGSPTWLLPACVAVLIGCVALVFCQVLFFQFLPFWDDDTNIHRNPLYSPLSWESVGIFWKGPFQQLYIPVTYTTWAALVAFSRVIAGTGISVGPINPVLFHGANLTTHLLSAWMVFLILRMLFFAKYGKTSLSPDRILYASLAGALFFALHPIQVESVSWVSGLRDLLGGGFSLTAIALFLGWLDSPPKAPARWMKFAAATLFLLLAFGSKPGSVVTPGLALLCGGWLLMMQRRRLTPLFYLLPWFVLSFMTVVMTSKSQPAAELARSLVPLWARPLVACDAIAFYLGKIFWPSNLCADYGRSPNSLMDSGLLFWTWVIPILLASILLCFRRLRIYLFPLAILVLGVLPTLGLIPFNFQVVSTVSDHYLYLAMLGPALAFAMVICQSPVRLAQAIALVLLPAMVVLTLLQLPQWAKGEAFFPATLEHNPTSWKSRHNYACTLDAQGKLPEALKEFEEAISLRPTNAEARNDMALTLLKMGRRQDAIMEFQRSLQIRATSGAARNLAAVLLLSGDPSQAAKVYRFAMQIDPGDLQNVRSLAWLLATHPDDSVRNGQEAVLLSQQIVSATNGQVPLFLLTLSAALAETGNFPQAEQFAIQASEAYRNSGDPRMATMVSQKILPALRNRQGIRDNPAQVQ
ncbi:MAG: tetratricopeptide repeat protein [Verrucomicrobia bacterium]|nr:MAG: tetratricopeptide repeat protein [Verrucomicrobiota bacterium]